MKKGIIFGIGTALTLVGGIVGGIFIKSRREKRKEKTIQNLSEIPKAEIKKNGKVSEEIQENIAKASRQ
jgi:hypothetical protein